MKRAALWVTAIGLATGMGMASAEQAVRKDVDIGAGTVGGGNTAAAASPTRLEMGTAESMENPAVIFARKAKQAQAKDLDIYYDDSLDVAQAAINAGYKAAKAKNGALTKSAWVKSLAGKTDAESLYLFGACQWLGVGGPSKFPEAQKSFEAAGAAGSVAGKREHAKMVLRGQVDKGQGPRGFAMMQALGDVDADAMVERGIVLANGWAGVTADRAAAMKEFEKAAAKGSARAYFWMSTLLTSQPQLTDAEWAQAAAWTKKAADGGQVKAMRVYGMMLERGYGVPADPVAGTSWILKAANAGESEAQFIMSQKYRNGIGVGQDSVEALSWARTCAQDSMQCAANVVQLVVEVQPDGGDAMVKEAVLGVHRIYPRDEKTAEELATWLEQSLTMPFAELERMAGLRE